MKTKLVEIARSFSYKKNLGNYSTADFFCSAKKEVEESKAEETSEQLYQFAKKEVVKSINEFEKNGLLKPQPPQIPISQEHPEAWKNMEKAKEEGLLLKAKEKNTESGDGYKQNSEK